jgi:multiple sugar transport system ATP-binding protein
MNLIDGELREETGSLKLMVHGGAEIALSGRVRKDMLDGQRHAGVSLGVRAQDIYLGNRRAADDIEMRGVVEVLERVGPRRLAYIQVLQTIFLVIDDQDQLHVGDEVPFFLPSEKCMAFDLSSGLRLGAA